MKDLSKKRPVPMVPTKRARPRRSHCSTIKGNTLLCGNFQTPRQLATLVEQGEWDHLPYREQQAIIQGIAHETGMVLHQAAQLAPGEFRPFSVSKGFLHDADRRDMSKMARTLYATLRAEAPQRVIGLADIHRLYPNLGSMRTLQRAFTELREAGYGQRVSFRRDRHLCGFYLMTFDTPIPEGWRIQNRYFCWHIHEAGAGASLRSPSKEQLDPREWIGYHLYERAEAEEYVPIGRMNIEEVVQSFPEGPGRKLLEEVSQWDRIVARGREIEAMQEEMEAQRQLQAVVKRCLALARQGRLLTGERETLQRLDQHLREQLRQDPRDDRDPPTDPEGPDQGGPGDGPSDPEGPATNPDMGSRALGDESLSSPIVSSDVPLAPKGAVEFSFSEPNPSESEPEFPGTGNRTAPGSIKSPVPRDETAPIQNKSLPGGIDPALFGHNPPPPGFENLTPDCPLVRWVEDQILDRLFPPVHRYQAQNHRDYSFEILSVPQGLQDQLWGAHGFQRPRDIHESPADTQVRRARYEELLTRELFPRMQAPPTFKKMSRWCLDWVRHSPVGLALSLLAGGDAWTAVRARRFVKRLQLGYITIEAIQQALLESCRIAFSPEITPDTRLERILTYRKYDDHTGWLDGWRYIANELEREQRSTLEAIEQQLAALGTPDAESHLGARLEDLHVLADEGDSDQWRELATEAQAIRPSSCPERILRWGLITLWRGQQRTWEAWAQQPSWHDPSRTNLEVFRTLLVRSNRETALLARFYGPDVETLMGSLDWLEERQQLIEALNRRARLRGSQVQGDLLPHRPALRFHDYLPGFEIAHLPGSQTATTYWQVQSSLRRYLATQPNPQPQLTHG